MNLKEKVAYLKGLSDGLKLDEKKDEVKVINAMMDLLSDMAEQITDTNDKVDGLAYTVESIDDELADFVSIEKQLDLIDSTVESLKIWVASTIADGKIDKTKLQNLRKQ